VRPFLSVCAGGSHLGALVDGIVPMPNRKGHTGHAGLAFGWPGFWLPLLELELQCCTPQNLIPDIVCLLAPGNNLIYSPFMANAGKGFRELLCAALLKWTRVNP
jgi:hypothetical protein